MSKLHPIESVPYEGAMKDYVDRLIAISGGDFTVNYTYISRGAVATHGNPYVAAVNDVQDGLIDMSIASFWITGERLKMTTFTTPLCESVFLLLQVLVLTAGICTDNIYLSFHW